MPISHSGRAAIRGVLGLASAVATLAIFAAIIGACGSKSKGSSFDGQGGPDGSSPLGDGGAPSFQDSGLGPADVFYSNDAFFATDPPPCVCPIDGGPMDCNVDGGPGGTPMCPADKNREGCPCATVGQMEPCWPGLRANRGIGDCKDGVTTCMMLGEQGRGWGPCVGAVLPIDGGTAAEECKCFSTGEWAIANVSPCLESEQGSAMQYALSTYLVGMTPTCPMESNPPPFPAPTQDWSTDSLTVDCAGNFNLCFTIKAGMASAPSPSDCTVAQVCIDAEYATKNVMQQLPDLPGWAGMDSTCATQFYNSGGYGEMSVQGKAVDCESIDNGMGAPFVFEVVPYCPINNPPAGCQNGGTGSF
jgi:hypothetical protein